MKSTIAASRRRITSMQSPRSTVSMGDWIRVSASPLTKSVEVTLLRYISFLLVPRSRSGHLEASGAAPKSEAVSRSALLGGPVVNLVSAATEPAGQILDWGSQQSRTQTTPARG